VGAEQAPRAAWNCFNVNWDTLACRMPMHPAPTFSCLHPGGSWHGFLIARALSSVVPLTCPPPPRPARPVPPLPQIAFGSGFKCNSAVWRALRNVNDRHEAWLEDGKGSSSPPASTKA